MARKILFEVAPEELTPTENEQKAPALTGMARSLQAAAASSVRDIDVSLIDDSTHRDRLEIDSDEIAALAESIRQNGQLVPILVSPMPKGRFRIVYGRRRLAALRVLGQPAKALVRDLTDDQAIIAQGQENTARKDLSWIEKAMFAAQLLADGKSDELISDALNIDQKARASGDKLTTISRIKQVIQRIPTELIRAIGPAPGIGRDRWYSMAQDIEKMGFTAVNHQDLIEAATADAGGSDARFMAVSRALSAPRSPVMPMTLHKIDAAPASVKATKQRATITITAVDAKELHAWVRNNPQAAIDALVRAQSQSEQ